MIWHTKHTKGRFRFDAETGEKLWGISLDDTVPRKIGEPADKAQFFQTGIDSSPIAYESKIIFTTASAHVYCLNQEDGEILWKTAFFLETQNMEK
ncbi:MAG: PQQ-binding-like beta-propeller repeat protein [Caldisericia bacterium]